jgi:hypothetical protein
MNTHTLRPHPSDLVKQLASDALKGMKVCFINMPLREAAKPNTPPQGPGLIAARLRQYGAEPVIIDLNAYRIDDASAQAQGLTNGRHLSHSEAQRLIEAYFNKYGEPDVIGLSGKITTLKWQQWTARACRTLLPDAFLISGGGLATEFKEGLFNWVPELDAIGHSEGDDIMLLCVADVKRAGKQPERMADSLYYYGDLGGKKRWIYHGDRPHSLDMLPFAAWDLLEQDPFGNRPLENYIETPVWGMAANNSSAAPFTMQRSLTTVSSRGCPHACRFCFRGAQGERDWGIRSPENLRAEAEWLIKAYGVDFIGFPDDNFAVSPKRCQALPKAFEGLKFRWGTHTRLDECTMNRLEPMAESGCIYIGVGAESASKNTLYAMDKGGHIVRKGGVERMTAWNGFEFPTTMMEGIENCRKVGIHTNATWMMAYPKETLRDLQTSVAFIKWQEELYTKGLMPQTPEYEAAKASVNRRIFTATWYPGTSMVQEPKVRELLTKHFGISFEEVAEGGKKKFIPACDDAMRTYVEELDDATKVLVGTDGAPLNFSDMPEDVFLEARAHLDNGEIEKVLAM